MSNASQLTLELKPGEILIKAKTSPDGIFIVKEGQLQVYREDAQGHEIPLAVIGSGEYIGETAYFTGQKYSSNVVAITKVKLAKIPDKAIKQQIKDVPKWMMALLQGVIGRLHQTNEILRRNNLVDKKVSDKISAISDKSKAG